MKENYFIHDIRWCESHGFPWTIRDNSIYWQTAIQTAQLKENGEIFWHSHDYFDKIINEKEIDEFEPGHVNWNEFAVNP